MKKLISIILTLSLVLSLSVPAFAETNISIAGEGDVNYKGYQLMSLTYSLKTTAHPDKCNGTDHGNDCYNYSYTVVEKYRTILQNEVKGQTTPPPATVTDQKIIEYFSAMKSNTAELRAVADRIYRAIKAAGISADAEMAGHNNIVKDGYWMIADVRNLSNDNDANSLVMLDTKGHENISVQPKEALPEFEKKVKDINNSSDANLVDNPWADSADHDMGDAVPFKLTGTLPNNVGSYNSYKMVFHDTLDAGFALSADKMNYKVLMYSTKAAADGDAELDDTTAVDVTANFTPVINGQKLTVTCENVLAINGATADTAFVVYYEAALDNDAIVGGAGNANTAYLEYSNDPYSDQTGKSTDDIVKVYTYKVVINKTDKDGNPLPGAGFKLYKKNAEGDYVIIGTEKTGGTSFEWTGLDDGDYKLEESTVPAGYNKIADVAFTITAAHSDTAITSLDGGNLGTGDVSTGTITKAIENHTGIVLPETGAKGTMMLLIGSSALILLAGVFMVTRKKMSIYED